MLVGRNGWMVGCRDRQARRVFDNDRQALRVFDNTFEIDQSGGEKSTIKNNYFGVNSSFIKRIFRNGKYLCKYVINVCDLFFYFLKMLKVDNFMLQLSRKPVEIRNFPQNR